MIAKFQQLIIRGRWFIVAAIPVLCAVNQVWGIIGQHTMSQIGATLAALGLVAADANRPPGTPS